MKQLVINGMIGLLAIAGLGALTSTVTEPATVFAQTTNPKGKIRDGAGATGADTNATVEGGVRQVVNALLFIVGAISVIVIIIAGIMFTVSAGDPAKAKKAKDAILYAVIGLVVAILGYAIVEFVIGNIN